MSACVVGPDWETHILADDELVYCRLRGLVQECTCREGKRELGIPAAHYWTQGEYRQFLNEPQRYRHDKAETA